MPCLRPWHVTEGVLNPTVPLYNGYSPAWGQFEAEQVWGQAHADVIKNSMKVARRGRQGVEALQRDLHEDHNIT